LHIEGMSLPKGRALLSGLMEMDYAAAVCLQT
jgi:hypothetical protein